MAITRLNNNSITSITALPSGITTGKVLQVVSDQELSAYSFAYTSPNIVTLPNISLNITPSYTTSKILLMARVNYEISIGQHGDMLWQILRGSSSFQSNSEADNNRRKGHMQGSMGSPNENVDSTPESVSFSLLDTTHNSTSQLTYTLGYSSAGSHTVYVNRTVGNVNSASYELGTTELIAMEIAP
jgi:hypothetical protein